MSNFKKTKRTKLKLSLSPIERSKIKRGHEFTSLIRRSGVKKSKKIYSRKRQINEKK